MMTDDKAKRVRRTAQTGMFAFLLCAGLLAGCAGSGDVEKVRQERTQAKAKMSAELQQERVLAASMEKDSEAKKAAADKLAAALGGKPPAPLRASSMSLTTALATAGCTKAIAPNPPNPAVPAALYIDGATPCSNVTVGAADATFTAQAPLMPVVIGSGGTLTLQDQAMTLYASSFLIQTGGTMQAGSVASPIQNQITIVMAGNQSAVLAPSAAGAATIVTISNQAPNARDITVMDGGTLALYGAKGLSATPGTLNKDIVSGTKSWTYLAVPAGPANYNDAENVSAPVPATVPDSTLTLATQVDWQAKDWVSVATTSFSSHQTEIVQICGVASVTNPEASATNPIPGVPATVSRLTLCPGTKLKHYHYGGLAPTPGFFPAKTTQAVVSGGSPIDVSFQAKSFYDDASRNYGIDERAEVALLSRNIKLTSVAGQPGDANNFIGGHLVAMVTGTTPTTLQLAGVEIEKFGQGLVGRYPVHLHKLPSGSSVLIQDVSVHHAYNKCYVVHGTGNANFYNNVCVRTVGQGMYLEDGTNITGNQFMRNHIAGTMAAGTTYSYPQQNSSQYWDGDNLQGYYYSTTGQPWYQINNWYNINNIPDTAQSNANHFPLDSTHPGGFWITNLANTFVNNSVAGCQLNGRGYWLLAQGSTATGYPEFTGNRVHGCYNGIDNDDTTSNAATPSPMLPSTAQYAPVLLLTDNTITRSRNKAAWFRNWYATLHNHRFATNLRGFSLLVGGGPEGTFPGFWGLVYQNVIAGMTRNNVERYPACAYDPGQFWPFECTDVQWVGPGQPNYAAANSNILGYSYYDGPARVEHNRFVNFRFDPTGIYPNAGDRAARLLTSSDINTIAQTGAIQQGQLEGGSTTPNNYQGYVGDAANGWQTSNAQTVPPTQYIRDSIWDNVDFKHQVYTEAVNMGPFNDGDKTTVIRDLDSHLTGLRVVDGGGNSHADVVPISLNSVDYYATDYTVDEPHSGGHQDFRATSLMSPHKYATLNIESATNPASSFRVVTQRDMPAYGDTVYPSLFLYGRGQKPIFEPFVMDRMGYMVYGAQGTEHKPPYTPTAFESRLLFSYTDPPVHHNKPDKPVDYFVNRIAVYQPVNDPKKIAVYRIRRQWGGQQYGSFPPGFIPPGGADTTCDNVFWQFTNGSGTHSTKWNDCVSRASQAGGMTIQAATGATAADQWTNFEKPYKTLMGISNPTSQDITNFINGQTFYYDTATNLLYFYMIEDKPVQKQYSPFGTCDAANYKTGANYLTQTQQSKPFSDPNSVQAALDASCLVSGGTPQQNDLFVCHESGCAAYLVDLSTATVTAPSAPPSTPPHPISRADYSAWNQYHLVYGTPKQEPNGVSVPSTAPTDGTPLPAFKAPVDGSPPPTGNQITYPFLSLDAGVLNVTENFRYHCVTTPPWSAVNPRGAYPPSGGFTYPLPNNVCTMQSKPAK